MTLDIQSIRVVAFDIFNTVVRFASVPKSEIKAYADHIKEPEWSPLKLPDQWRYLPAFEDAKEGLARLRRGGFQVVPLTNGPAHVIAPLSHYNSLEWDAYFPLESYRCFKPNDLAYRMFSYMFSCSPSYVDCLMVTANKDFGDLEASRAVGMQSILIRGNDGGPQTIIELAEMLGA